MSAQGGGGACQGVAAQGEGVKTLVKTLPCRNYVADGNNHSDCNV